MEATQMTWLNCYSQKRIGTDESTSDIRSEYERDWDRIIFSSPFRRLQNKTQVFPLPEEVFVHNRLTHSLEVASVGRSLGQIVGKYLSQLDEIENSVESKNFYKNNLKNVVSAACLAHDLGNPAFGHSGEEAISKYFKTRDSSSLFEDNEFKKRFSQGEWNDLTHFEGNANAFRILTMEQRGKYNGGLKLTYSTVAATIKYPCESLATKANKGEKHRKKYGYFKCDENIFLDVTKQLNMLKDESDESIAYIRHPFVYLVEAADDICYNIIDLEDSHRLGILSYDEVKNLLLQIVEQDSTCDITNVKNQLTEIQSDYNEAIAYLRAKAINILTIKCAEKFIAARDVILKGEYKNTLIEDLSELASVLKDIKRISLDRIYNCKEVVKLEIAGFRIMQGLVEEFVTATLIPEDGRNTEQRKILALLPSQFKCDQPESDYRKVVHVIDFIAGMTDLYALKLYRNLRGIEI